MDISVSWRVSVPIGVGVGVYGCCNVLLKQNKKLKMVKCIALILGVMFTNTEHDCQCHGTARSFFQHIDKGQHILRVKIIGHERLEAGQMIGISNSVTLMEVLYDYTEKIKSDTILYLNGSSIDCMVSFSGDELGSEHIIKGFDVDNNHILEELKVWGIEDSVLNKNMAYFELFDRFKMLEYDACDIGSLTVKGHLLIGNITRNRNMRKYKGFKRRRLISKRWAKRFYREKECEFQAWDIDKFETKLKARMNPLQN